MTSPAAHRSLRVLAPFPPEDPQRSRSAGPLPKRTKRSNACTACKSRKSKCGGGQPCNKCNEIGTECIFDRGLDRRRKLAQRHAEQELSSLHQLLYDIVDAFDAGNVVQLGELLSSIQTPRRAESQELSFPSHEEDVQDGQSSQSRESTQSAAEMDFKEAIEAVPENSEQWSVYSDSATSVGSLREVDTLTEDPNRNLQSRAAGYIGKESEIAWMQKLDTEATKLNHKSRHLAPPAEEGPVASMSYHVDFLHIADSLPVEPRLLPPRPWAARLVNIFFESIAPSFPLINKPLFESQFSYAYSGSAHPTQKWLAVLNLVFAISSKHYQLAEPVTGKDVDDRLFLSRAISLNTSHNLVLDHADLHQVQFDLLLAIYYMAAGQINRSWQTNGRAARSATSLGLNLRALGDQIDPVSKETRTRIWWCIFSLEHLLAGMTGRSSCVDYRSVSLYPPVPYDDSMFHVPELEELLGNTALREERLQWTIYASDSQLEARTRWFQTLSPTQSLYFFHLVDLSMITHAAVTTIYSLTTTKDSISGQSGIRPYQEKLQTWLSSLHPSYAFTNSHDTPTLSPDNRYQVSLALAYYSSQIILSRPCLTRPGMNDGTNIHFTRSRFGNDTARTCVQSALSLISILPKAPSTEWLLQTTPWWCILHFLMQALTVLLIQLSIGPIPFLKAHGDGEANQAGQDGKSPTITVSENQTPEIILTASKKALRWLHTLAKNDPSSHRAFQISESFIRRIGRAKGLDLSGIPDPAELAGNAPSAFSSGDVYPWAQSVTVAPGPSSRQSAERLDSASCSGSVSHPAGMGDGVVNWGPDCTVCEAEYERQQESFALDPALFSVDM